MTTITVQEAQARLAELVHGLVPGEEILLTEGERPVAKVVGQAPEGRKPRRPGSARGKLTILVEDDEHLEGFEGFMG